MIEEKFKRIKWSKLLKTIVGILFFALIIGLIFWLILVVGTKGQVDFPGACDGRNGMFYSGTYETGELYNCKERTISDGSKRCLCEVNDPARADYECSFAHHCGLARYWECRDHKCFRIVQDDDLSICPPGGCVDECHEGESRNKRCDGDRIIYDLCVTYSSYTRWFDKSYDCQINGLTCIEQKDASGQLVAKCMPKLGCGVGTDHYLVGEKICDDPDGNGVYYTFVCDRSSTWKQVSIIPCKDINEPEKVPEDPVVDDPILDEDLFDPESDVLKDEGCLSTEQNCEPCQIFAEDLCECFETADCYGFECENTANDCLENQVYDEDFCQCYPIENQEEAKQQYLQDETISESTSEKVKQYVAEKKGLAYVGLGFLIVIGLIVFLVILVKRLKGKKTG